MGEQSGKHMVAVLPHGFGHDQRRVFRYIPEHRHPVFLTINEPVALLRIEGVPALHPAAFGCQSCADLALHVCLSCLTLLICNKA
jgi:hypothetical protein